MEIGEQHGDHLTISASVKTEQWHNGINKFIAKLY